MKKRIGFKILIWVLLFCVLSLITFGVENFMGSIHNMISGGKFDFRFSAGDNSHLGQWILIGMFIPAAIGYFSLMNAISKKFKIFNNIFFVSFLLMLVMFIGEFGVGLLANKVFNLDLWDYSNMEVTINGFTVAFHLLGQINVFYIPVWYLSSFAVYVLMKFLFIIDDYLADVLFIVLTEVWQAIKSGGNLPDDYYKNMLEKIKG